MTVLEIEFRFQWEANHGLEWNVEFSIPLQTPCKPFSNFWVWKTGDFTKQKFLIYVSLWVIDKHLSFEYRPNLFDSTARQRHKLFLDSPNTCMCNASIFKTGVQPMKIVCFQTGIEPGSMHTKYYHGFDKTSLRIQYSGRKVAEIWSQLYL